jgi:hypothetical protein
MTVDALLIELLRARPHGWSVVRSGDSLSVRPPDRSVCKFNVFFLKDGRLGIGRFDHSLNHWTGYQYIEPALITPEVVFEHMRRRTHGEKEFPEAGGLP